MTAAAAIITDSPERVAALLALVLGIIGSGTALAAGLRRQARTIGALADAILGQEEVRDRSGAPVRDAQPGLAAQVKEMRDELSRLANDGRRISALEDRLTALEDARVERVVSQAESAAAWGAISAAQQPPEEPK